MYKKTLLSALLISSFSISSLSAAAPEPQDVSEANPATRSKQQELSSVVFNDANFQTFPLNSASRTGLKEITFHNCTLREVDPTFFMNNPELTKVSFARSSLNFTAFLGSKFGQGCVNLVELDLKNMQNLSLEQFLSFAASDLLDQIMAESCKVKFSRADSGATLARFTHEDVKTEELTIEEIKRYISMYRTAKTAAETAANEPTSQNTGGLWGMVWSIFGTNTTVAKQ